MEHQSSAGITGKLKFEMSAEVTRCTCVNPEGVILHVDAAGVHRPCPNGRSEPLGVLGSGESYLGGAHAEG